MIGKTVLVIDGDPWYGEIKGVIDEEYFSISSAESPAPRKVSMYKIRSTNDSF